MSWDDPPVARWDPVERRIVPLDKPPSHYYPRADPEAIARFNAQLGSTPLSAAIPRDTGMLACACTGCYFMHCRICACRHGWEQTKALTAAATAVASVIRARIADLETTNTAPQPEG